MNAEIARLRAQIAADRASIRRRLATIAAKDDPDNEEQADHLALNAHRVYTALEAVLERVALALEGSIPAGARSHQELLDNAFLAIPGVRPAVLSAELRAPLRDLCAFRHLLRHAYDAELSTGLMAERRAGILALAPLLDRDLEAFDLWLAELGA